MNDDHHVQISSSAMSCGVATLRAMASDPERVMYALCTNLYHPSRGQPYAFAQWSDTPNSNGAKFAEFVEAVCLTDCVAQSLWLENPKTGNTICIWTFAIPHEQLKKWYVDQRLERAKKL